MFGIWSYSLFGKMNYGVLKDIYIQTSMLKKLIEMKLRSLPLKSNYVLKTLLVMF